MSKNNHAVAGVDFIDSLAEGARAEIIDSSRKVERLYKAGLRKWFGFGFFALPLMDEAAKMDGACFSHLPSSSSLPAHIRSIPELAARCR